MTINKSITSIIENSIPLFVRLEYPRFVEFITLYYTKEQSVGSGYEFLANMFDYSDIDRTDLTFLENFAGQYLCCIPDNILPEINKRTLIKYIREYYSSVGTESAIKFLFRILFNESIELYYPRVDMLRVSDGKWQNDIVLKVTNTLEDDSIVDLEGTEITGETSKARALVDRVKTYVASDSTHVAELYLTEIDVLFPIDTFIVNENITGTSLNTGTLFNENIFYILNSAEIVSSGLFNAPGDVIQVISNIGVDAFVIVNSVQSGSIDSLEVLVPGTGYAVNQIITFTSGSGSHARARITTINGSGGITGTEMINVGYGYKEAPLVNMHSTGTGAVLYPVSTSIGKIDSLKIINFGVNYNIDLTVTTTKPYHILYYYDNISPFVLSETITGITSGATGTVRRLTNGHVLAYVQTSIASFIEGEDFIGNLSGATGMIHVIETSVIQVSSGAVGNYDGYYANTDSFVSSDKYIQDSYYYQDFSYVINTLRPREQWINQLKESAHPSGGIVFGFGEGAVYYFDSYGEVSWISALWDNVEIYKDGFSLARFNDGSLSEYSNTQNQEFDDAPVYYLAQLDPDLYPYDPNTDPVNTPHRTSWCNSSTIKFTFDGIFYINIDNTNHLLIDNTNTLLL